MFAIRLLRLQEGELPQLRKNDSQPDTQFHQSVSSETELYPTLPVFIPLHCHWNRADSSPVATRKR
jgi:hypothetical protein